MTNTFFSRITVFSGRVLVWFFHRGKRLFRTNHVKQLSAKEKWQRESQRKPRAEPLEERLPVSASFLGVAAGAAVAGNYGNNTGDATPTTEYRSDATYGSDDPDWIVLTELQLDGLSVPLEISGSEEVPAGISGESGINDTNPDMAGPVAESGIDLTKHSIGIRDMAIGKPPWKEGYGWIYEPKKLTTSITTADLKFSW